MLAGTHLRFRLYQPGVTLLFEMSLRSRAEANLHGKGTKTKEPAAPLTQKLSKPDLELSWGRRHYSMSLGFYTISDCTYKYALTILD